MLVQHPRLAGAVPHRVQERQGLGEAVQHLLFLPEGVVERTDDGQRRGLARAVPHRAQERRAWV